MVTEVLVPSIVRLRVSLLPLVMVSPAAVLPTAVPCVDNWVMLSPYVPALVLLLAEV